MHQHRTGRPSAVHLLLKVALVPGLAVLRGIAREGERVDPGSELQPHLLAECSTLEFINDGLVAVALDSMVSEWHVGGVNHILCQSIKPARVSSSSGVVVGGVQPTTAAWY
jgi:hypothetical protein